MTPGQSSVISATQNSCLRRTRITVFAASGSTLRERDDYTAKEFLEYANNEVDWKNVLTHPQLTRQDLQGADYTFSSNDARDLVMMLTLSWLKSPTSERPLPAWVVEKAGKPDEAEKDETPPI